MPRKGMRMLANQKGSSSREAEGAVTLQPLQKGLVGDLFIVQSAKARGPCLNLLLVGLEFKLTILPQQRLRYKNFLELWALYSPQENNDLEQSPENDCSFHMCLLSCILDHLYWAWPMAGSVHCGNRPGEEKQKTDKVQFLELTINYSMERTLM